MPKSVGTDDKSSKIVEKNLECSQSNGKWPKNRMPVGRFVSR